MRSLTNLSLTATLALAAACGAEATPDLDALFATSRNDVQVLSTEDGLEVGRLNTTHRIAWEYATGYSALDEDHQTLWGPLPELPRDALQSIARLEDQRLESVASGASTTTTPSPPGKPAPDCVCLYYSKVDGKCIWWRC